MVKNRGESAPKYVYRSEKEEYAEAQKRKSIEKRWREFEEEIQSEIREVIMKNSYDSLMNPEKSETNFSELEAFLKESGFEDHQDITNRNLVRKERKRRNPESVTKMLETSFRDTESGFGKSEKGGDSSSSCRERGLEKSKSRVVSLGIKLTSALIKVSLLNLHTSQRKKQLGLKNWILLRSYHKQSPVMFLIDFLLDKAEELAEFEQPRDSDVLSEDCVPENQRISDDMLKRFSAAICGLQSVAMNLSRYSGNVDGGEELNAMNLELDQCVEHVRKVDRAIDSGMMRHTSLRVKPFGDTKPKQMKCRAEAFWKKMDAEVEKCWGEAALWKYLEASVILKSVIRSQDTVYWLCLKYELRGLYVETTGFSCFAFS